MRNRELSHFSFPRSSVVTHTGLDFGTGDELVITNGPKRVCIPTLSVGTRKSNLASLRTEAVKGGGDYVINDQKIFVSLAHFCDYIWLAARTDPHAKEYRGIFMSKNILNERGCISLLLSNGNRENQGQGINHR